jgi:hypothetical protein
LNPFDDIRFDDDYEYLEEGEALSQDVLSTEGCFACKLGKAGADGTRNAIHTKFKVAIFTQNDWSVPL